MGDCIFRRTTTILSQVYDFQVLARVEDGVVLLAMDDLSGGELGEDDEKPIDFASWRLFAAAVEEQIKAYEQARAAARKGGAT